MLTLVSLETQPLATVKVDATKWLHLAEIIARKFYRGRESIKDTELYSVACEELVRVASEYDPAVGEFSRFAFRALRNAVIDHIRHKKAKKRTAVFETLTDRDWQDIAEHEQDVPDGLPAGLLGTLLADTPSDTDQDRADKRLLEEIYLQGVKVPVIAERHGISRVTVYNRLHRILGKIQQRHAAVIEKYGGAVDECPEREPCRLHGRGEG